MSKTHKLDCCICYNPELDELIYESKEKLETLSENIVKTLFYGYSCDKKAESTMKLLRNYISVLEEENRKIVLGGKECLDCDNLQRLAEKVRRITTSCNIDARRDIIIDRTGVDAWLLKNPSCASYEKWEKLAYRICGLLNLDVRIIKEIECDLDFTIFSSEQVCNLAFDITRELIPCDIMVAISIHRQACDLDFKITRTEKECLLDFNILKSEVDCDLNFKAYKKLIDCNLSFDVIRTVYENNCSFTIGDPIQLVSPLNAYPLDGFNFRDIPDLKELEKMGINITQSKYANDPAGFIRKIKSDYHKK